MKPDIPISPNAKLDLTGLTCPSPLLGAKRVVDDLQPGEVLELVSDCPGTRDDLFIWARHTGNEIVKVELRGGERRAFFIRKGRSAAPRANVTLDMRDAVCPGPVLEARRVLEGMKAGEVLRLVSRCPAAHDEVRAWSRATGQALLLERESAAGEREFYLQRTA
jgi:TusA-related sulfurtransferase